MFVTDLLGNSVYLPPLSDPGDDLGDGVHYRDLVLVVRGGVSIRKTIDTLHLDPAVIARLIADGTLDGDLKLIQPIDQTCWSEEYVDLDTALIRLFADQSNIQMRDGVMG